MIRYFKIKRRKVEYEIKSYSKLYDMLFVTTIAVVAFVGALLYFLLISLNG